MMIKKERLNKLSIDFSSNEKELDISPQGSQSHRLIFDIAVILKLDATALNLLAHQLGEAKPTEVIKLIRKNKVKVESTIIH